MFLKVVILAALAEHMGGFQKQKALLGVLTITILSVWGLGFRVMVGGLYLMGALHLWKLGSLSITNKQIARMLAADWEPGVWPRRSEERCPKGPSTQMTGFRGLGFRVSEQCK